MHLRDASERRKKIATILTFITIPLSGFMTDIYLPSFPSMAGDLDVSEKSIQLTLTCFFLSYGFAQLFVGSILDSIGRFKPALISLAILALSSLGIAFTESILLICILRIVQGLAISIIVVGKRTFFVDLYDDAKRKYYLSYFTIVWSCGPILAPFLGGYLEDAFQWQSNFYFLAAYAAILFFAELIFSGETIRQVKQFNLRKTVLLYLIMLKNKGFLYGILILGVSYSVVMVFNIAGPFVVEHHFHFTPVVIGYCTLILGVSWMIGGIISKKLTHYPFSKKILISSVIQIALVSLFLLLGFTLDSLYLLIAFAFLIHICSGFLFTNFFTYSLLYFPTNAGIAGGLLGGLLYIITSIGSYAISSSGPINDTLDMSMRYFFFVVLLTGVVLLTLQYQRKKVVPKKYEKVYGR